MRRGTDRGRAPLLWTALAAGGLGLLGPALTQGGRLSWLGPLVCLPLALGVGWLWRKMGDLPAGMERAFGPPALALYYLWSLVLLTESAIGYARRLVATLPGDSPWLFLAAAALLCPWLCRGDGRVALRAGRLFFGAVAVVLTLAAVLSLPGLRWENLWPMEEAAVSGLPASALLWLSLAGYGVYGLCLPGADLSQEEGRVWPWGVAVCCLLAGLLLALTGSFGWALAGGRAEPILLLLEGVQVPGVFRHGEAALEGGLALADLTLMTVLMYGAKALWGRLLPRRSSRWGLIPAAGAILAAGLLPDGWWAVLGERVAPAGNLLFGAVGPALALLTIRRRKGQGGGATFCDRGTAEKADVGGMGTGKKS